MKYFVVQLKNSGVILTGVKAESLELVFPALKTVYSDIPELTGNKVTIYSLEYQIKEILMVLHETADPNNLFNDEGENFGKWFKCSKCGFRTSSGKLALECHSLPVPEIKFSPGDRVKWRDRGYGTVLSGTRVKRVNRRQHNPSHIRSYEVDYGEHGLGIRWSSGNRLTLIRAK